MRTTFYASGQSVTCTCGCSRNAHVNTVSSRSPYCSLDGIAGYHARRSRCAHRAQLPGGIGFRSAEIFASSIAEGRTDTNSKRKTTIATTPKQSRRAVGCSCRWEQLLAASFENLYDLALDHRARDLENHDNDNNAHSASHMDMF